jgi:formate dehydrogenase iron-sulfur subunit
MNFGDRAEIMDLAQKHLAVAKKKYPNATLLDPDDVRTIYLVGVDPNLYHEFAVASVRNNGITRQAALRKMFRPFNRAISALG